jgi:hypothetical protein
MANEVAPLPDPQATKLKGVAGWLAWFGLGCFLSPVVMVSSTLGSWGAVSHEQMVSLRSYVPIAAFARGFEVGGVSILSAGLLFLGIQLVRQHRSSGVLAVVLLTCLLVYGLAELAILSAMTPGLRSMYAAAGQAVPEESFTESYTSIGRAAAFALTWLLYFLRSKRVQATFGPVSWGRVGQWLRAGRQR